MRADRLGFDGYAKPTSPALDAVAREAIHFGNAFAQSTWTKPSIGSMLSSRYPSELGLLDFDFQRDAHATAVLNAEVPLLAEQLSRSGWRTAAVVNQVHLSRRNGFARGFDDYRYFRGRGAAQLNRRFAEFLAGLDERSFFAYVHYLDVHWPYDKIPRRWRTEFGQIHLPVRTPRDLTAFQAWQRENLSPETIEILSNRYDVGIRRTDQAVGELVDILRRAGRWQNTILVVTADHGEGFYEHQRLLHGFEPYVEVSRVPLVLRVPERFGYAVGPRSTPVGLIDLAPTLLDLAGAAAIPGAHGRSLRDVLSGHEAPTRLALTQAAGGWAVRDARYSLVALAESRLDFFDRATDPGELQPLDPTACGAPCERLAVALNQLRGQLGTALAPGVRNPLTPDEIEELRALGYL